MRIARGLDEICLAAHRFDEAVDVDGILRQIGVFNDLHRAHVEQAGFAVLKAPDIPSILVETAFLTNPDEERKLKDENYQDQMAQALLVGIRKYFAANPPLARSKLAQN